MRFTGLAVFALAASLAACGAQGTGGSASGSAASKKEGEAVASIGKESITVDEFKAKMNEQSPFVRARYTTLERKKEFLDNLVRFELLAQEAQRMGMDKDPDVQETLKKIMVQTLIRKQFDENEAAKNIPDAELEAYYKEHIEDYVKPERVRVSHVLFAAEGKDKGKLKAEAAKALIDVKGKEAGADRTAFVELAKARSDDADSKLAGGDLSFKTKEELAQKWGQAFADAAFGVGKIGDMAELVESDKGIHLVKLTGRQNALDRPFETVKSQIQNRLFRERRTKNFDEFVKQLREKANVKVNDELLASIEVVAPGGAAAPGGDVAEAAPGVPGQPIKLEVKPTKGPGTGQEAEAAQK